MTSATEKLRRMLDKRGIEYSMHEDSWANETYWIVNHNPYRFSERSEYGTCVLHNVTPEQAISATLGSGTCYMELDGAVTKKMDVWFCDECGSPTYNDIMPSFCQYCGAKVVNT